MNTRTESIESIPETWNDEIDTPFFALTARLFSPDFVFGAGVLLAASGLEPLTAPALVRSAA
jgi:hypothetical protein